MLRFRYENFLGRSDEAPLEEVVARTLRLQQEKGSRNAIDFLFKSLPLEVSPQYNDAYCALALEYHLGILSAWSGKPEEANARIGKVGIPPDAGGQKLFSEVLADGQRLDAERSAARDRGLPSIFIASMPRSASATFTQTLAGTLGLAILRLSVGAFPRFYLIDSYINRFSPGGGITHDHFGGDRYNLEALKRCGVKDVFVVVRDPRASAASAVNMSIRNEFASLDFAERDSAIRSAALTQWIPWLKTWLDARSFGGVNIHWILSSDIRGPQAAEVYRRVIAFYARSHPAIRPYLETPVTRVNANVVRGDDDAWREQVSPSTVQALWDALPSEAIELLGLQR